MYLGQGCHSQSPHLAELRSLPLEVLSLLQLGLRLVYSLVYGSLCL